MSQIECNLPAITRNGAQHGDTDLAAGLVLQVLETCKV